jgi:hypothetical protein
MDTCLLLLSKEATASAALEDIRPFNDDTCRTIVRAEYLTPNDAIICCDDINRRS